MAGAPPMVAGGGTATAATGSTATTAAEDAAAAGGEAASYPATIASRLALLWQLPMRTRPGLLMTLCSLAPLGKRGVADSRMADRLAVALAVMAA